MRLRNTPTSYGLVSRTLHWLGAASILLMLATGYWADHAPNHVIAAARMGIHASIGMVLYLLIAARVLWHFAERAPEPLSTNRVFNRIAKIAHLVMLGLIMEQLITGPVDIWSGGWPIGVFGWFKIPSPMPAGKQPWHDFIGDLHGTIGYILMALVALHLAAVVKHTLLDRDGTLRRMLSGQA